MDHFSLHNAYSSDTDPTVAERRIKVFGLLLDFINVIFFQEFFKFFVTAFTFKDWFSTAVNAGHIV